ncbi:hypothetical protein DQW50_13360 [Halorubrum sp. 48-1-W]|uniref:hypothetical protein n=1 Tax=Halorubrum sp. 48-1-W TaxID=2249761 RepID=UPI000DCDC802|nr:hypothetical protein [Halorubrum sp. 48-1-W]RAW44615.1 hypothetical protein DQW50_13360 [Halorubrum sp. 48-1-W]
MSTVVAIETPTGVAIVGDTRVVDGGTVSSDRFQRVFDLGGVGIGIAGKSAAVQEFYRSFEVALRDRGLEISDTPDIDAVARIAARETEKASVDAVVGARDADTGGEVDVWTIESADRITPDVRRAGEGAER